MSADAVRRDFTGNDRHLGHAVIDRLVHDLILSKLVDPCIAHMCRQGLAFSDPQGRDCRQRTRMLQLKQVDLAVGFGNCVLDCLLRDLLPLQGSRDHIHRFFGGVLSIVVSTQTVRNDSNKTAHVFHGKHSVFVVVPFPDGGVKGQFDVHPSALNSCSMMLSRI